MIANTMMCEGGGYSEFRGFRDTARRGELDEHGGIAVKLRRYVLGGYVIWWAVLVALYYGLPGLRAETWGLIGLSGASGIVAGVAINRPSRKLPWLLLAAGTTTFTAGQVSFLVAQLIGVQLPFPSFADVLYLLTYPLYAAGLLVFILWRTPDRDRRSLIDALTLTAGLAMLSWIYLILPNVHTPGLSWLQKSVAIAYPLGDVLVLAMIARLLAHSTAAEGPLGRLSPREREVLSLMAQGRSNAAIAAKLFITEKAVSKHAAGIFANLGLAQSDDDNRRVLAVLAYLNS